MPRDADSCKLRGIFAGSREGPRHPGDVMNVWFTADLHLGDANIIRYSGRPFVDADAMNRALIDRWNEVVDGGDDVWLLGDSAMGKIDETLPLVGKLRGRKLLLTGNHDRCWADHCRRAEGWTERYLEAGFAEVVHGQINVDIGGTAVVACHFPYRGDSKTAAGVTLGAIDALRVLFAQRAGEGVAMTVRASGDQQGGATIAASMVALVGDLLEALP